MRSDDNIFKNENGIFCKRQVCPCKTDRDWTKDQAE